VKYAKQRDANEVEIVDALRAVGCTVTRLGDAGVPDLLVGRDGRTYLLEVKMPMGPRGGVQRHGAKPGGRGDLTPAQVKWWDAWRGERAHVVRSVAEALFAVGMCSHDSDGRHVFVGHDRQCVNCLAEVR
jgi:hypothetical protein